MFMKYCFFFIDFKMYSGLWPLIPSLSVCVHRTTCLDHQMAGRSNTTGAPAAEFRKTKHFEEKNQYSNEHPVA